MARRLSVRDVAGLNFFTRTGQVFGSTSRVETVTEWHPSGRDEITRTSTPMERAYFSIRDEVGTVTDVAALGVGVSDGQRVTIVYAGDRNETWGHAVGVYNHNSRKTTYLKEGYRAVQGESKAQLGCFALLGVALLTIVTFGLALVVLIVWLLAGSRSYAKIDDAITRRVDQQIRKIAAFR